MGIQKEKELYLAELLERGALKQDEIDDLDFKTEISAFHSSYLSARFIDNINFGWSAWQAAKAQAVPEGFVLVPKINSEDGIDSMALRYRHDFPLLDETYRNGIRSQMRQLYEEAIGLGFYTHQKY